MNNNIFEVTINGQTVLVNEEIYRLCVTQPKSERRAERRRKQDKYVIDQETSLITYIPSREDSFERLMEMGMEFESLFGGLEAVENKIVVEHAMKALTELQKAVITKIFFEGFSEREIALEYGITQQSVSRTKERALAKMKKELTKQI